MYEIYLVNSWSIPPARLWFSKAPASPSGLGPETRHFATPGGNMPAASTTSTASASTSSASAVSASAVSAASIAPATTNASDSNLKRPARRRKTDNAPSSRKKPSCGHCERDGCGKPFPRTAGGRARFCSPGCRHLYAAGLRRGTESRRMKIIPPGGHSLASCPFAAGAVRMPDGGRAPDAGLGF